MLDLALLVISVNYHFLFNLYKSHRRPPIPNIKNFPVISLYLKQERMSLDLKPVVSERDYFSLAWLFKIAYFLTLPKGTETNDLRRMEIGLCDVAQPRNRHQGDF